MKTVHVNVTQKYIDEGVARSCKSCPESLAIQEATGNPSIRVENKAVYHYLLAAGVPLPEEIRERIQVFDETGKIEPHSWSIELPDHWVKK